jgi:hypothetical protein
MDEREIAEFEWIEEGRPHGTIGCWNLVKILDVNPRKSRPQLLESNVNASDIYPTDVLLVSCCAPARCRLGALLRCVESAKPHPDALVLADEQEDLTALVTLPLSRYRTPTAGRELGKVSLTAPYKDCPSEASPTKIPPVVKRPDERF